MSFSETKPLKGLLYAIQDLGRVFCQYMGGAIKFCPKRRIREMSLRFWPVVSVRAYTQAT